MKRKEATKVADVIQGLLDAFSELSAEVNGRRAANWSKINTGLYDGEKMLSKLRTGLEEIDV